MTEFWLNDMSEVTFDYTVRNLIFIDYEKKNVLVCGTLPEKCVIPEQ